MNVASTELNSPSLLSPPVLTSSERRILGLLFRKGAMTQSSLVELMDLTQQSVSRVIGRLSDLGMIEQGERVSTGRRGYPSTVLKLKPDFARSFGVSLKANTATIVFIDFSGLVVGRKTGYFKSMMMSNVLPWIKQAMSDLRNENACDGQTIVGAGVGITGSYMGDGKSFNTIRAHEDWFGIDLNTRLSEEFSMPICVDNDGNVAALGESMIGVGRWADNFAYLYISTGVGGGVVLDGKLWRGRCGNAGEFAGGLPPNIFPFPNLELLRQLVARDGNIFSSVDELVENFDLNWTAIDDWIARVRDSLSIIASNATAILDLDAIVLGGQMPPALAEKIIPHIEFFDQKRRGVERPTAKLVPAEATDDAAATGAAILPLMNSFFD